MPNPTRFSSGLSTGAKGSSLYDYLRPDPTGVYHMFMDFLGTDFDIAKWTITETQAAATQLLVAADATGEYGIFRHTNSAAAPDISSIQLITNPVFLDTVSGKKWWMKARISRDNADAAIGFGMQAINATPFTVANGIWVSIAGASTDAVFRVAKASASSTLTVTGAYPTSTLNTFITLGMYYDGKQTINCYVDQGVTVPTGTPSLRGSISTLPVSNIPIVAMTPTISLANTTANARNMDIDYYLFAVER